MARKRVIQPESELKVGTPPVQRPKPRLRIRWKDAVAAVVALPVAFLVVRGILQANGTPSKRTKLKNARSPGSFLDDPVTLG